MPTRHRRVRQPSSFHPPGNRLFRHLLGRRRVNRRRGAPRSVTVRRLIAGGLAVCAILLALRDHTVPAEAATAAVPAPASVPVVPLVLEVDDAAAVTVLREGQLVDVYASYDAEPPTLVLTGVELLSIKTSDQQPVGQQTAHIVVAITSQNAHVVESLLKAASIIATVSTVHF